MTTEYNEGRKYTYDKVSGGDDNFMFHENITVIDGVEYDIHPDAPRPVQYGVEKIVTKMMEGADIEAYYSSYNYITHETEDNVPVPSSWYVDCEPYKPPSAYKKKNSFKTEVEGGKTWRDNDYKRNIDLNAIHNTSTRSLK